jgi:hypothetical protein
MIKEIEAMEEKVLSVDEMMAKVRALFQEKKQLTRGAGSPGARVLDSLNANRPVVHSNGMVSSYSRAMNLHHPPADGPGHRKWPIWAFVYPKMNSIWGKKVVY